MDLPRKIGAALVLAGSLLLAIYVVPTVYGAAMARIEMAQFRAQTSTNRLWDAARVRAYRRSLGVALTPEAVLRVPKLGIEVPVFEGTSELTLNRGVGHISGTALPGQSGNIAISGHRDGFFRPLKDIAVGDMIEIQRPTKSGEEQAGEAGNPSSPTPSGAAGIATDRYKVIQIKIVFPSDTSVLNKTSDATLTLVTCFPFYYVGSAPERYIVQASLQNAANTVKNTTGAY